jgi:hypothetical protein
MYDLPDFYLVANPIGRYSIGDRTPGLRRDARPSPGWPPRPAAESRYEKRWCG